VADIPLERVAVTPSRSSDLTLLDVADRLLDTGVSLMGEATISVADVDLIYLGLDVVLASVDKMRGQGNVPIVPFPKWPTPVPGVGAPGRKATGPGAMSATEYQPVAAGLPERIDVDPDDVEKGLGKLVLTIIEFVRQLLERQAIRRMQSGSLSEIEVERIGIALMRLDEKVGEMAARFGLRREELRLGLGPLGELL
jgi:hypothetical protein